MNAMKNIVLALFALLPALWATAQENHLPAINLRDVDGKVVCASSITDSGRATLLVFWKSSSIKCCENLETLYDAWTNNLKAKGIKLVAICIDCNGSWTHVKPIVNGNDWDFETYIDVNGDFKRAMSIGDGPCSLLFDQDQNLVYWYNAACTGSEEYICHNLLEHLYPGMVNNDFKGFSAKK